MQPTELSEITSVSADAVQQPLVVALSDVQLRAAQKRRLVSAAAVFAGCVLSYLMLGALHATTDGLPWYLASGVLAVFFAHAVARPRSPMYYFSKVKVGEPLSLAETGAIAYLSAAVLLYAWVLMHEMMPAPPEPKVVNVVDIEFTSGRDFSNMESPLPGTEEAEELHKRQSDQLTAQGSITANKIAAVARKTEESSVDPKPHNKPVVKEPPKQPEKKSAAPLQTPLVAPHSEHQLAPKREEIADTLFVKPMPQLAARVAPSAKSSSTGRPSQQPLLEEVQPPEMVEMMENDGNTDSTSVFQVGGSTEGGKGASNDLSAYIKDLHHRIKNAWSPPRGQSRKARLLFRIRKDGRLAFLKITQTSGDSGTDEAAIKAITSAVKGHQLPPGYTLGYLDVQYTFNYTADEIKELTVNPQ